MPVPLFGLASLHVRRLGLAAALLAFGAVTFAPASYAHADETQRAKDLFQQGTTLFNLGEFDKAIEAWQEGYKAKPDPGFLYNIGQAYRLKGDAAKAIFFYKGYLRNSPKAPNRAEIEAKIAALQKEASEPKPAPAAAAPPTVVPPPVLTPAPAPMPGPAPVAPPPAAAPPLAGASVEVPPPAPVSVPEAPPSLAPRHWDLGVGFGFDSWTSGLNIKGAAPAQGSLGVAGAYSFGDLFGSSSFRLGALLHASSLDEGAGTTKNTLSFTSLLLEPSMRVRLVDRRLYLVGGVGVGVLAIGGVKTSSVVLAPKQTVAGVSGTLSTFELRVQLTLQVHVLPWLGAFVSPALSRATKPQYFYEPLNRTELLFGLNVYF